MFSIKNTLKWTEKSIKLPDGCWLELLIKPFTYEDQMDMLESQKVNIDDLKAWKVNSDTRDFTDNRILSCIKSREYEEELTLANLRSLPSNYVASISNAIFWEDEIEKKNA